MTEAEWLVCQEPGQLKGFLNDNDASMRKFRLLACASCRRVSDLLTFPGCWELIDFLELRADGLVTRDTIKAAADQLTRELEPLWHRNRERHDILVALQLAWTADVGGRTNHPNGEGAHYVMQAILDAVSAVEVLNGGHEEGTYRSRAREQHVQCAHLRDIFGNPFRPVTFLAEWRTTTALALATGIYDERAFDRLPILADALQDASCNNDDILTHLRDTTTPHVRGCWALDLVLGKE